ncbi:MAG: hypothetical protein ABIH89_09985 [Elusimicrobiota bacterium]
MISGCAKKTILHDEPEYDSSVMEYETEKSAGETGEYGEDIEEMEYETGDSTDTYHEDKNYYKDEENQWH